MCSEQFTVLANTVRAEMRGSVSLIFVEEDLASVLIMHPPIAKTSCSRILEKLYLLVRISLLLCTYCWKEAMIVICTNNMPAEAIVSSYYFHFVYMNLLLSCHPLGPYSIQEKDCLLVLFCMNCLVFTQLHYVTSHTYILYSVYRIIMPLPNQS
jgi:hypothetical protein